MPDHCAAPVKRLRTRAQFQALLSRPAVARTAHFALHRMPVPMYGSAETDATDVNAAPSNPVQPDAVSFTVSLFAPSDAVWLGAMTPKRWARRAVTRNTIRRQVYAVGECLVPPLAAGAQLVRLRAAFSKQQFPSATSDALRQAVRAELHQLFQRGARMKVPA